MTNAENPSKDNGLNVAATYVGRNTLVAVGVVLVGLGVGGSFFFSQTIEKFFWEARTASVIQLAKGVSQGLQKTDITSWQETESRDHLDQFAKEIKSSLPSVAALKIFTPNGVLAWTDLRNVKVGQQKPESDGELARVRESGHMIMTAGESTKLELNKTDLLEVWTTLQNPDGSTRGFVELYFDSNDIVMFVKKIQYTIWGVIAFLLGIVVLLLRLAFRKQDELIIRQAHELSGIIEKSPIGIYMIDQKGTVVTVNPRMLELLKEKDAQKIIGQNVFAVEYVQKMEMEESIRKALIGIPFEKEASCASVDCVDTYHHYHGTPILGEDGKTVERVLLMVEDATEQKKLEENLAKQAKSLEVVVGERTKELEGKIAELEQFQKITVDRELRMMELKQEIEHMREKLKSLGADTETPGF